MKAIRLKYHLSLSHEVWRRCIPSLKASMLNI